MLHSISGDANSQNYLPLWNHFLINSDYYYCVDDIFEPDPFLSRVVYFSLALDNQNNLLFKFHIFYFRIKTYLRLNCESHNTQIVTAPLPPRNLTVDVRYKPNGHLLLFKWMIEARGFQDGFLIQTCSSATPPSCKIITSAYSEPSMFEASQRLHTTREDLVDMQEYVAVVFSYTQNLVVRGAQAAFTPGNYLPQF